MVLMSYLFVQVTSPIPSTLCAVTKRIAYAYRQMLILCITTTFKGRDQQDMFVLFHMSPLIKHTNVHIQMYGSVIVHLHD